MPLSVNRIFSLFHTDNCERQALQPLGDELESRGCHVKFSNNIGESADVGIYCHHAAKPNAKFSVITLHDLAQRHDIWPSFWLNEPWDQFDIGILPGPAWEKRWLTQRVLPYSNPRIGVFKAGWPKSDLIFKNQQEFEQKTAALRASLDLPFQKTILYAPSWENDGKQEDFVQSLKGLPVNLLLKQAPWPPAYQHILRNIDEMNLLHRGSAKNIRVIDPEISIMYCIGISDLLVSDESSVLIEASLYDVPSVAVIDWTIPDRKPPRPACVPFEDVRKISRVDLRKTVEDLLGGAWNGTTSARNLRDAHFSDLGNSSKLCADLILAAIQGTTLPLRPLEKTYPDPIARDLDIHEIAIHQMKLGKHEDGLRILMDLASNDTGCWQVFNTLGVFLLQQSDLQNAKPLLEVAVRKSKGAVLPLRNLAEAQAKDGDLEGALSNYGKIISERPNDLEAIQAAGAILCDGKSVRKPSWLQLVNDLRGLA